MTARPIWTLETYPTYDLVRFHFADGTSIAAGRVSSGRWMLSSGNGWSNVDQLRREGWIQVLHRGPACYGHADYYVSSSLVASIFQDELVLP